MGAYTMKLLANIYHDVNVSCALIESAKTFMHLTSQHSVAL